MDDSGALWVGVADEMVAACASGALVELGDAKLSGVVATDEAWAAGSLLLAAGGSDCAAAGVVVLAGASDCSAGGIGLEAGPSDCAAGGIELEAGPSDCAAGGLVPSAGVSA